MRCSACGQENPERAKFCLECGTALAEPAASRESRRTVTVVFADMVGFTALGERLDQESLRRVMDRFYDEMRGAIEAQSGTLAKFIGDAVLAVWGTPEVREDDALRAVRAADAMRGALAGLNEDLEARWDVRVGMRTGVNTGEVVVDPTRPADLLVGDTLNVAARLEQAAGDGEVLIGPDTYRLVRDDTILEPVEPLALKGKTKPMPAWRVIDSNRPVRHAESRLQAPLVGRSSEIAALRAALDAVIESRSCRMTTVIGSPGLGKTRLVSEFVHSVAGEAIVLQGRCQATGEGITFQPVAEVLRAAAGIDDDETPEAARHKLAGVLPENEPDRDRIVAGAAALLGLAPIASTEETFWAVRRILEALGRDRPVVLVHDDIHWGQPTFLDLLEHFVEWIRDAPVFVIALARPELREVRPGLTEPGGIAEVVALEPLDAEGSRALVTGLLGDADLPEGLAQRILETTEGNPLFLSETLRMLADEGFLRREGNTWIAGDMADVAVPPTIHALLAARIERLDTDERSVVERAAVIGHSFYRGAVTELAPAAVRPGVDGALETLSRKELVRAEDEWWLDEQVFRFHHVLIRDAAYRSLLKEARAELHERFAAWLETKAGELAGEHEEVIAFHLEQAHAYRLELGPLDEAGRLLAAAAAARLHSAGCRALAREDLPAAINLLTRALAPVAADAAGRLEVLVDLAEALLSAGDTGAAEQVVEELGLGADELGDERLRARAMVFATQLDNLTGAGHVRESADAAAAAAETLLAAGDRAGEAKAHQVVAQAEALLGQVAAAEAALDRALVAARAADDRRRITAVLSGAPRAALWGPAPIVRASGRCLDVVRILRMTPGNRHVEAAALRSQAVLEAMRGRGDAARGILDSCRTTLEELGLTLELHETAIHAGLVELLAGDPAEAERHLRGAHDGFRTLGVEGAAAQAGALLARALAEQGRDDEALEACAYAEAHGGEDLKTTAAWLGVRAEVLSRRSEHAEALQLARRAAELTHPTDALADKADALMTLAIVESAAGDAAAAKASAEHAREHFAAKDHSVGVERAETLTGTSPTAPVEGAAETAPPPEAADRKKASVRRLERFVELHRTRDYDALTALNAPDFQLIDTRQLGWEPWDRDTFMANQRSAQEIGADQVRVRMLAADDRCSAEIVTFAGTSPEGAQWDLTFGVVDLGGDVLLYGEIWDPEDEAAIVVRFEAIRALAPTATAGGSPEVAYARDVHYYNIRDWAGLRSLYRDDVLLTDRRQLGWEPIRGADALTDFLRTTIAAAPDMRYGVVEVLARTDRAIALTTANTGSDENGVAVEIVLGQITLLDDDGRFAQVEFWDPDDKAGILARFAELTRSAGVELSPSQKIAARAWREAFEQRDWERLARFYVPDVILRDQRVGIRNEFRGVDAVIETLKEAVPINGKITDWRPIAAVSERLMAFTQVLGGVTDEGGPWEMVHDQVTWSDGQLRVGLIEIHDDRAALMQRLEELRAEPLPPLTDRRAARFSAAFAARDWEGVASLFAPTSSLDDRRSGIVQEATTPEGFVALVKSYVEQSPDVTWGLEPVAAIGERVGITRSVIAGTDATGGAFELRGLNVTEFDEEGRQFKVVVFDEDQLDEAHACLRELAALHAVTLAPWVEPSDGTQRLAERIAGFNRHDVEGIFASQTPDAVVEDHRPGTGGSVSDRQGLQDGWSWTFETMPDICAEALVLQDAGDVTHSLVRYTSRQAQSEVAVQVVALAQGGLVARTDLYEPDGLEAAARFAELTGEREPLTVTLARQWQDVFNARDWELAAEQQSSEYLSDDRRPLGGGVVRGSAKALETARGIVEVAPDVRWRFDPIEADDDAGIFDGIVSGHGQDGGEMSVHTLQVVVAGRDGRTARVIVFDESQREDAFAEYRAWAAHGANGRAVEEAINARDFDRVLRDLITEDFTQTDRRPVASAPNVDAEGFGEVLRAGTDLGPSVRVALDVLEVRGDRRTARVRYTGADPDGGGEWEIIVFTATQLRDGRMARSDLYATQEEAATALDELGDPWARAHAEHVRRYTEIFTEGAVEQGVADMYSENLRFRDHRPVGTMGDLGHAGFLEQMRSIAASSELRSAELCLEETDGRLRLARSTVKAIAMPERYLAEIETWYVSALDDHGRVEETHLFADEGLAREWWRHRLDDEAFLRAYNGHDVAAVGALLHDDFVLSDMRPSVSGPAERLDFLATIENIFEMVPDVRLDIDLLAVSGNRRLARFTWTGHLADGGGEMEIVFFTIPVMEDGLMTQSFMFETEHEALARFDELREAAGS